MKPKTIPSNYNSFDGKIFNLIEAVIFDVIYLLFIYMIGTPLKYSMYIALGIIPITVFSLIGIEDQSVVTYMVNYICFLKKRRILSAPSPEYIRKKNREILMKKAKKKQGKGVRVRK